mmetsp:Transcript_13020/g.28027  ORF Transcript_13020/g.28027 Transcript_13020/m.28027 type:complete len:147 (-) Transcript_13020:1122-1562(-)|eukprot:CAMPEP_0202894146 /NCGR_PEP_ID=MMETSP1392-20130828/3599_1 /ASSEMBLY_ACC=CAM_ASM_000868 /TAXON_ID=225041 /ORGANISM="Chlamydomonas chlamydogama, Strain SAG 11-48b" /LENGTH=146 /DNA_ID=CAMNT_0049578737 /DNA_START=87 /DNA_END=527 /DNA_ORIENTATION=-
MNHKDLQKDSNASLTAPFDPSGTLGKPPKAPNSRFKIVAMAVSAMNRWKAAINPTYTYGAQKAKKREEEQAGGIPARLITAKSMSGPASVGQAAGATGRPVSGRLGSGRAGSGRTASGRPDSAGSRHGYKASLLFRALPKTEEIVA